MATPLRVLIVDDEPLARARLRMLLGAQANTHIVGEAGDGHAALHACRELHPDLVLLDISMPGINGLDTAHALFELQPPPAIVFCTAFDEHALSAFEAHAVDYLVKPVRAERLASALDKARVMLAGRAETDSGRSHLIARLGGSVRRIAIEDVHYLQADEKYVVVHHAHGEDLIEESLKALEAEFGNRFLRIHRNCLVARAQIAELRRAPDGHVQVVLRQDGRTLEVSRRCVTLLREALEHS